VRPANFFSNKIKFFKNNDEIIQNRICNAQDVKVSGQPRTAKKRGDICGMRVKDVDGVEWEVSIEVKNYTTNHNAKLSEFFDRVYKSNVTKTKEIYIYLSLNRMENPVHLSCKKQNKVFLLLNGLEPKDYTLDIRFLSTPVEGMTVSELVGKLVPSITRKPTLQNVPQPGI
jgi:hypothetical protein